ncbi:MAG: lytic transglycosylase domain-containing protein [Microbacterium sp.]
MRSNTSTIPARRARRLAESRARRRPLIIAGALAFGLLATAGATLTAPTSMADAAGTSPAFALASFTSSVEPVATVTDSGTDRISTAARKALSAAQTAITAASTVSTDIQASGLDVGVADITVDTTALAAAVKRLDSGAQKLPAPLVPDLTDDVTALVATVNTKVSGLRGSLDAAIAVKAEQDAAAAQAQAEAEAAAAAAAAEAEAQAAQSSSSSSGGSTASPSPAYAGAGTSAGEAQSIARGMLAGYGWGDDQFGCLVALWDRESGWNSQAYNAGSGAYGIPQALPGSKMASAGADWQTNAATQISWGLGYISGRYGSPCGAWSHSESVGWY